ncbi:extracellular solute-binding protein [bacterium]|nr:MAG: extracellular solute-binding protein [bacterium]
MTYTVQGIESVHLTRSTFLKGAGAAGAAATTFSVPAIVRAQAKSLRIITWSHFVPAYDAWFDPFAKAWGRSKGIDVVVDHISYADLVPRATSEVAAGQGHDLAFFLSPPAAFEPHVLDLSDLAKETERRYGPMVPLVRSSTYNSFTKKAYGFSAEWTIDPGDYLKDAWTKVGKPGGPVTWEDLLTYGLQIKKSDPSIQIPIGIGMSQDIDSNMAMRALLWSYGGAVQDAQERVTLDSDETVKAVEFGATLFQQVINPAVLSWNAASNNQAFNARQTSYILNSISAYRTAQDKKLPVAENTFFVPALKGPTGIGIASEHVMGIWVVWKFAKNPDAAKEFLLHLCDNYREACMASKLYNTPSFMGTCAAPGTPLAQKAAAGQRWVAAQFQRDPFGSAPADKLAVLATAEKWSTNIGHPGPANPAIGEIFDTFVIPDMFAKAATKQLTPKESVKQSTARVNAIFAKWRKAGLVGG